MVRAMGVLRDLGTGDPLPLPARIVVGRAPTAALRLDDKRVSGEHSSLSWNGARWEIRDLGSRNGTFVDGARLLPGEPWELAKGARLGFGTDEAGFVLEDCGPPGPVAREVRTGALRAAADGLLALPTAEEPQVLVFADARGVWVAEQGDERRPLADGDVVEAGGRSFVVSVPAVVEGTAAVDAGPTLDTVRMEFAVSRDEEHVTLSLVHRGRATPLEEREHGYVLLTLARQRLDDRELPPAEQGWIDRDELLRMLQLDTNGLNVAIYRARGQLAAAGLDGAAGIVEVRRGQRRIGIDPDRLAVRSM
jgi:hypothetical protein